MEKFPNHPQVDALLKGDETTIRILYNTLFPKVKSFVFRNRGNELDAEEIFHEALYQLIARAKVKGVTINSSFEAYFFTICKNLWYKELNKRKKEVRSNDTFELKDKEEDFIASIVQQERWELFEEMIKKLTESCIKLLKEYFNKVPYHVIVKKFSYSSENVAFQRVFKCKKRLTELIKEDPRYKNL